MLVFELSSSDSVDVVCPPDSTDLASAELSMPRRSVPSDTHWHHKLEAAQNAIFCKEVFAQVKTHLFNVAFC